MKLMALIILSAMLITCQPANESNEDNGNSSERLSLPEWAKNATIYEANIRHMSDKGDFKGLEDQLQRINNMGVDILWLMPIHPISLEKRKATNDLWLSDITDPEERKKYLGSPYAVADYKKVNPDYGTMGDFKSLLAKTHELGMKLIIDWVPNHTGWDHHWISEHPDWYTQDSLGNIIDPINYETGKSWGWIDVADLNYDNEDMRKEMISDMSFWLRDIGIDGFRCDVAHGVPQDFWNQAIPEFLKINKDIFMLAESSVPSNLNEKTFHMDYGWSFHHIMNEIARGEKNVVAIDKWMEEDSAVYKNGIHMHFTSNHDENTWAGTVFERMGDAHKVMAVLAATFEGMPLLYSGMEEPMTQRLPFFTKGNIGFENYAYADFYTTLFELKHRNQALWNEPYGGSLTKWVKHDEVFAFSREKNGDRVICVLNLDKESQAIEVPEDIEMNDVFAGQKVKWSKGQIVELMPWGYYVLSSN